MTDWRRWLGPDALRAHAYWLRVGREGGGRLELEDADLGGVQLSGVDLTAASFNRCDLSGAELTYCMLAEAQVTACRFDRANLSNSTFDRGKIEQSTFEGACLDLATFHEASLHRAAFTDASLIHADFRGAHISEASFRRAVLRNAHLVDAAFLGCGFREANLSRDTTQRHSGGTARGSRFVACDFRHADVSALRLDQTTFERCGFHAIVGIPRIDGPYRLVSPDHGADFDGSGIGPPEPLQGLWEGSQSTVPDEPPLNWHAPPPPTSRSFVVLDPDTGEVVKRFHVEAPGVSASAGSRPVTAEGYDGVLALMRERYREPWYRVVVEDLGTVKAPGTARDGEASATRNKPVRAGMVHVEAGPVRVGLSLTQAQSLAGERAAEHAAAREDDWSDVLHPFRDDPSSDPDVYVDYLRASMPVHSVNVPSFEIDVHPVTEAAYAEFILASRHRMPPAWKGRIPSKPRRVPVTGVDLEDARAYAAWAGKRLPTEAEWEKAARGLRGQLFPWDGPARPELAFAAPQTIGEHEDAASPYGLQDVCLGMWEWCDDSATPYPGAPTCPRVSEAVGAGARVLRGGTSALWPMGPAREFALPGEIRDDVTFRCAVSSAPAEALPALTP